MMESHAQIMWDCQNIAGSSWYTIFRAPQVPNNIPDPIKQLMPGEKGFMEPGY